MIREPAVAGQFYPADPAGLRAELERCLGPGVPADTASDAPVVGLMVPHAGYVYSGRVAGDTFRSGLLPEELVILCPNHTGRGRPIAVMSRGGWRTPLGTAPIDEGLADAILQGVSLAEIDDTAHRDEHSLEVQLPFLQVVRPGFSFVPICVGTGRLPDLLQLGEQLASAVRDAGRDAGIVISSDMSHYISARQARDLDMIAIERITAMDPGGLHRVVEREGISMCGYAPAVAGLAAALRLGATRARLVSYANSGEASGDYDRVVAYAGIAIS